MELGITIDTLWVLLAGCLVFFMNSGFAMLETGFCQSKNAINILAKKFIVFGAVAIAFWATGFSLMFTEGSGLIGRLDGLFLLGLDNSPATGDAYSGVFRSLSGAGIPLNAKFFFEVTLATIAASIVSGAMAERIRFVAYVAFSAVLVAILYPVAGHWIWGGGWLHRLGFLDTAGSTVIHSVGGWAALSGSLLVGPRKGKYLPDGRVRPIPGHNMSLATLGTLILWTGWFGLNAGSLMRADPQALSLIAVNTSMAAATGSLLATLTSASLLRKPDLGMTLNGALAGLVAISGCCNLVSIASAALVGTLAGLLVVLAILLFERARIDDPVGVLGTHLVNGVWGTLAVGLFSEREGVFFEGGLGQLAIQAVGVLAVGIVAFLGSSAIWLGLREMVGLRVGTEDEERGLDLGEHGLEAYPEMGRRATATFEIS